MNFLFLGIFFGFLRIYFLFKSIKINLKKLQKADLTRAGPRGSATQAHAAYIYIIYILLLYIVQRVFSLPYREGVINRIKPLGLINPTVS